MDDELRHAVGEADRLMSFVAYKYAKYLPKDVVLDLKTTVNRLRDYHDYRRDGSPE